MNFCQLLIFGSLTDAIFCVNHVHPFRSISDLVVFAASFLVCVRCYLFPEMIMGHLSHISPFLFLLCSLALFAYYFFFCC